MFDDILTGRCDSPEGGGAGSFNLCSTYAKLLHVFNPFGHEMNFIG